MDFIFATSEETDKTGLFQGDLLVRNDALKQSLGNAHTYYAEAPDYTHFLVLTQSCDLVRRGGKKPKSRYITLAAARPVSLVVDRFLERCRFAIEFPVSVCEKAKELQARQLLERLIHNTEDGFFFLKRDAHLELVEDLCVFLTLSVAIRVEHYDACLSAKIAQMDNIFAAKVGWLTGNLYSRIGTPDVEEKRDDAAAYKERFYEDALLSRTAWMTGPQFRHLKTAVTKWKAQNPGAEITREVAHHLLQEVPTDKDIVVDRVLELLRNRNLLSADPDAANAARLTLLNDVNLWKLVKGAE